MIPRGWVDDSKDLWGECFWCAMGHIVPIVFWANCTINSWFFWNSHTNLPSVDVYCSQSLYRRPTWLAKNKWRFFLIILKLWNKVQMVRMIFLYFRCGQNIFSLIDVHDFRLRCTSTARPLWRIRYFFVLAYFSHFRLFISCVFN